MRSEFIILAICVVASFALPESRFVKREIEVKNDNQEGSVTNADAESIDNLVDNAISSNETTTEKNRCNCIRRKQAENQRRWHNFGEERRHENSTEVNSEEGRHPFNHTSIWQEKQYSPMARHHRHHYRHHHHHKNRTTTTPPLTTTTSSPPLSEIEE